MQNDNVGKCGHAKCAGGKGCYEKGKPMAAYKPVEMITLAGFGDFSEDPEREKDIREAAERLGLAFYPTYYDHELKGDAEAIEKLTEELWSMGRDEWSENALHEEPVVPEAEEDIND